MNCNLTCSREEAIHITLDEYAQKYFKLNKNSGNNAQERNGSFVYKAANEVTDMVVDTEPKPYKIRKFNRKNYWKNRKHNQQNNYNQNWKNNQVAVPNKRNRKTRWSSYQPYQQLLYNYTTLTKHLPSLLNMRINPPGNENQYKSNANSSLVETMRPTSNTSIDQMSTLADQLLKKFDTLYEIRQSIIVEQEKKTKYNIPIQKEIATIQNKTLFVKCPNSEVITSDGPGIEQINMPVHSTNLSNNMRFA